MVQIKHLTLGQHTLLNERFADVSGTSDEQDKKKERKSKIKETTKEDFKIKGKFNY